jgi:hypothetical protein
MFAYGTVAEYFVGFVILTLALNDIEFLVVSKILRSPIFGAKAPRPPLPPAGAEEAYQLKDPTICAYRNAQVYQRYRKRREPTNV